MWVSQEQKKKLDKLQKVKNQIFEFHINLDDYDREVYRDIQVRGTCSLYDLAMTILKAFDFDSDHAFGFYARRPCGRPDHNKATAYELFADEEGCEVGPNKKGVSDEYVYEVFVPKKKMVFLFDYGDNWEFLVECRSVTDPVPKARYPKNICSCGKAPEQYPDCDE